MRGADARSRRRLQRHHPAQGHLRRRGRPASAAGCASTPARWRCRTSSRATWACVARPTSPSARPSRRTRSSTPTSASSAASARRSAPPRPRPSTSPSRTGSKTLHVDAAVLATGYQTTPIEAKAEYHGEASQRPQRPGHGATALTQRPLRPCAAAVGRQDPRSRGLRAVRRLARRDPGRALLLARVLHVRDQAGDAALGLAAAGRHHHLLHGHPRLRQGLRAVLPDGPGHGHRVRQGQGRAHRRAGGRRPASCASSASEGDGSVDEPLHDLVVLSVGMQPGTDPRSFVGVDLDTRRLHRRRPTPSSTPPAPALRGSSPPAPPSGPRTSSTPSSRPAPPRPRSRPTSLAPSVPAPQKARPLVSVTEMGPEQLAAAGAIEEAHHGQ